MLSGSSRGGLCRGGARIAHHRHQITSGSGDARPYGADRAVEHLGRLVVLHAEDLGEHERTATVGIEMHQNVVEIDPPRHVGIDHGPVERPGGRVAEHGALETPTPTGSAGVVDARPPGDREQPPASRAVGTEPVDRPDGTLVGLLREVVGVFGVTEVSAQPPDVGLGLGDEPFERNAIAVARRNEEPRQMVHCSSVAGQQPVQAVTMVSFRSRHTGTNQRRWTTVTPMEPIDCETTREALSARADGEATSDEIELAEAHLDHCSACRSFAIDMERLDRMVRIRPAEPVPSLVASVTARARPARLGRGGWLRPALAWVAVVMLVQSLPALLFGETSGTSTHMARHLGAFGAALAIGFAYAAWKPHRAFGLLPFTAALVATTSVSIVADVVTGSRTPLAELIHVTELAGLALLWMVAGSPGWRRRRQSRGRRLPRLDALQ